MSLGRSLVQEVRQSRWICPAAGDLISDCFLSCAGFHYGPGTCLSGFKVPGGSNAAELGHICGQLSLWRIAMFVMVRGRVCPCGRRPPALHRPSSVSKLFVFITLSGAGKLSISRTSVCFRGFAYIHGYSEWLGAVESVNEFEREEKIGFRSGWWAGRGGRWRGKWRAPPLAQPLKKTGTNQ